LNPLDLGFTNPFSFVLQVFGDKAKSLSDTAHYNCPALYTAEAFQSGMSAGVLNAITGLDIFNAGDYGMFGVAAEAKGAFAKGFTLGNIGTNAVLYTNIARTIFQKTGQQISKELLKDIMKDPKTRGEFIKGFVKSIGQGALPSFTKTELSNDFEKIGYVIGIGISKWAQEKTNKEIIN